MPLKLVPPREGRSRYWRVRGAHLGVHIDCSTQTSDGELAERHRTKLQHDIEDSYFCRPGELSFKAAADAYVSAGGCARYLKPLIKAIGRKPAAKIDQMIVDHLAAAVLPTSTNATRNRQVYTPVIAILRRAGIHVILHRPRKAQGERRTFFLREQEAFALIVEAKAQGEIFGVMCEFLLYTGARISEALSLRWSDVDLGRRSAWIRKTKNGSPRNAHLPPILVASLNSLPRRDERVFRFYRGGPLTRRLRDAAKLAGVTIPHGVAFHAFRHSYGAWLRRLGMDTAGLVATGAWRSMQAAAIYQHVDVTAEARKADLLPTPPGWIDAPA